MQKLAIDSQTRCNGKAGWAAGTTTTITMANQVDYEIDGKMYRKPAVTNAATPTTDASTGVAFLPVGVNKASAFLLCLDAVGAIKVEQGGIVDIDANGNILVAPQMGAPLPTLCPTGYLIVKVGATGSPWTFGVSNLAGPPTGVTFAFQDLGSLPSRPQVS